jgi:glycosyltransferase involved in cell wall biosynthesis
MSTYNGARFVGEQIESIRRQTLTGWSLLVRDDGSSDDTVMIVESLTSLDSRIRLVRDDRGNVGPAASYGHLLEQVTGSDPDYVALADQDDVWYPDKLERELDHLQRREREIGTAVPLLVHSDLSVVGEDLRPIHASFLAFQHLRHVDRWPLGTLLVQNFVTGCTVLINRALLRIAVPLPAAILMHDWWLALCAAAVGEVRFLPEPTVLYRQHGSNVLGSRGWFDIMVSSLRRPRAWWEHSGLFLDRTVQQALQLMRRVEEHTADTAVPQERLDAVSEFCSAFQAGGAVDRMRAMNRHRIRPQTLLPYPLRFLLRALLWSAPEAAKGVT